MARHTEARSNSPSLIVKKSPIHFMHCTFIPSKALWLEENGNQTIVPDVSAENEIFSGSIIFRRHEDMYSTVYVNGRISSGRNFISF